MAIQFIDLCSGIGGFHSGLMATGHYECVGHAEIDRHASKAYDIAVFLKHPATLYQHCAFRIGDNIA